MIARKFLVSSSTVLLGLSAIALANIASPQAAQASEQPKLDELVSQAASSNRNTSQQAIAKYIFHLRSHL